MKNVHGGDIYSYNKSLIDFSVNINPLGTPRSVYKAGVKALGQSESYPDMLCRSLRYAIAKNIGLSLDNIICGNGAAELIFNAVYALKPKKALLLAPTFAEYEAALNAVGTEIIYYELKEENGFAVCEDVLNYLDGCDMVFICNPNNPTGVCTPKELVLKITESGAFVIADECFMDFVQDNEHYSVIDMIHKYNNLFVLKAFTKLYAMPGIRLGFAVCGNMDLIEKMYGVRQPWNVSLAAQIMGIAALDETDLPQRTRALVADERAYLFAELTRLGISCVPSQVNFILFKAQKGIDKELLKQGILIRNCSNYRGLGEGWYRIAVKTHNDNLRLIRAVEVILWQKQL